MPSVVNPGRFPVLSDGPERDVLASYFTYGRLFVGRAWAQAQQIARYQEQQEP